MKPGASDLPLAFLARCKVEERSDGGIEPLTLREERACGIDLSTIESGAPSLEQVLRSGRIPLRLRGRSLGKEHESGESAHAGQPHRHSNDHAAHHDIDDGVRLPPSGFLLPPST